MNWRAHYLYQKFSQTQALEQIPDHNRIRHFPDYDMAQADRLARQLKNFKTGDDELTNRLVKHSRRLESKRLALENLYSVRGDSADRALPAINRGMKSMSDSQGRV